MITFPTTWLRQTALVLGVAFASGGAGLNERCAVMAGDLPAARGVLEAAVQDGAFPGCAYVVGTRDGVKWSGGVGNFVYDAEVARKLGLDGNPQPSPETVYDLASLTKVVGTTSVVLLLVAEEKLALNDLVSRWCPEFITGEDAEKRKEITVEHLLVHASGLPAWLPLYEGAESYEQVLHKALSTPLEADPGSRYRYSDLGLIILGEIASRAGGAPLAELEQTLVYGPLGMTATTRNPGSQAKQQIPPTELDAETREFVHGVVHDENSRAAGGVTGHAGLFSSANDLARFATEYLRSLEGKSTVLPHAQTKLFIARRNLIAGSSRALGWDTPSGRSSGGNLISPTAFGHTGFTGTSIWTDPERGVYFVLLTNRVHPTRENRKISRVRREFADAVLRAFDETDE